MRPVQFLLLPFLVYLALGQDCSDCVGSGKKWCVESSQCSSTSDSCATPIYISLNCPASPDPRWPYDDHFMRTQAMVLATAVHNDNPQTCFDNQLPTMKIYQMRTVNCSSDYPDVTCVGYTAVDVTQNAIVIAFKGAHGQNQLDAIQTGFEKDGLVTYFNGNGKIFKVIYDNFMALWNGGMGQDLRQLKYKYPDFELWINGHSLGAALGWTASSFIATIGLYRPDQMKIAVMAGMRVGDADFATWHSATFPFSYHVVHRLDTNPRYPPVDPHTNTTAVFKPRTEVWYNNYMNVGDPYTVCQEDDGPYCSEAITDGLIPEDHIYYFNIMISDWAHAGCPKNISAYAQQ